jgi:hypothetical protein
MLKPEEGLLLARTPNWNFTYTSERTPWKPWSLVRPRRRGFVQCYFGLRSYFKAGSINVRSVSGSKRFRIATGSTVTITSSVGDT